MSYAAYQMMHWPTGIENCASGYVTHSIADFPPQLPAMNADDLDSDWTMAGTPSNSRGLGPIPNLVVTAGNVLEVYMVRVQEAVTGSGGGGSSDSSRGGVMAGVSGVTLELICHYRLHGNVESMEVLSVGGGDNSKRRDSIILTFRDAKISVLEFDDATHCLRASSLHCFEGPEWLHLRRGKESFARGPLLKVDPQGRCGGVLVYDVQMIILKTVQAGSGLVGDEESSNISTAVSARIESSYVINLRDLDMKHIKDFVFLHGYIEPVLVVLHEQELTWAGRITWRHHTCMVSALSINTTLRQHPLIWSALNLPHDAHKLLAVPSPIGGVLVLCANSVHYHSQSSSCALGVNNFAASADSSQAMPRSSFDVELDAAHGTWLANDVVLLSTKTGELLLLTLVYDGRVVQRLDLMKSRASVLTSGMTNIGSSLFFLGSRLGDSLLVQYTNGASASVSANLKEEVGDIEGDLPSSKRLYRSSSDALHDMVGGEELSLYGSAPNKTDSAQKSFSFSVRDSLINIGPLKDFAYGLRINPNPNATGVAKQSNYELISCSGHGKNGALCILQRSIRPEVITEVDLPGCRGMWTVYHKSSRAHTSDASQAAVDDDEYHAYLIISLEARTMVLETADLLGEVTESVDYYVQGSTLAAGNLFGRRRVVQVYAHGARILDGSFMTQEHTFGPLVSESVSGSENLAVSSVSIADPYVLLKMNDGTVQLLIGDPSSCSVTVSIPSVFESSRNISACTLYHDKGPEPWMRKASVDAWLSAGVAEAIDSADGSLHDTGDIYCIVCYENGTLEIYDLPSFNCIYSVEKFSSGKALLVDSHVRVPSEDKTDRTSDLNGQGRKEILQNMKITELNMQRWSGRHSRPFLFGILTDGTTICYHAYLFEGHEQGKDREPVLGNGLTSNFNSASRLRNLRFVRVPLDLHTRGERVGGNTHPRLTMFKNIGGSEGLFLTGSRPMWLMIFRERVRVHPQLCDGSIAAFTVLHNVNCNHGFIYVTSQGLLKICQLPLGISFDNHWPVQKIPLKGTPHQVTYFAEKNLYPLIVSSPITKPVNQILSSLADQENSHQAEFDNLSSDEQTYTLDEFEIRILEPEKSGGPWNTRKVIPMQTSENALTVRMVTLLNTTTKENETLLAVGTAYAQGEDVAARGRVLLYALGRSENPQDLVQEVYSIELKGAISALASIQGHLLVASGPKVNLHNWTGTELNPVAFYDVPPLYVVSLNIVKNFILLGDVHKSIYFLSWKEQGSQLSLLAKDFGLLDCLATEFLIDGSTLSLAVSDEQKNLQIFYYALNKSESWKGQKLLSRAEFHVGAHVSKFLRLQMLPTSDRSGTTPAQDKTNRFALLFGTLDGSIGCIAPLDELTFRRLQSLQKNLVDSVPHVAGLNPKSFRQFKSDGKVHRPGPDNIVDCELLYHYELMPLEEQLEIAQQIGTTRTLILSNLNDLSVATSFL